MMRSEALRLIDYERTRQEKLLSEGRFAFTCASRMKSDGSQVSSGDRMMVLTEEVGEVAGAAIQAEGMAFDRPNAELRKELIHTAAVAVAWLEALDDQ